MLDKYQQEIVDSNEPRIIVEAGARCSVRLGY